MIKTWFRLNANLTCSLSKPLNQNNILGGGPQSWSIVKMISIIFVLILIIYILIHIKFSVYYKYESAALRGSYLRKEAVFFIAFLLG